MKIFWKKQLFVFALVAASLMSPAVQAQQPAAQNTSDRQEQTTAEQFLRTELFFGASKPDGSEISRREFRRFLKEEVTPRFPDGLTVLTGTGQFRDLESDKIIREKSMVLIMLYPLNSLKECSEKIEQIRKAYKVRFKQQSVLRVDDPRPIRVSF